MALMVVLWSAPASATGSAAATATSERLDCAEAIRLLAQQDPPLPAVQRAVDRACAEEDAVSDSDTGDAVDRWQQDYRAAVARRARTLAASQDPLHLLASALIVPFPGTREAPSPDAWTAQDAGAAFAAAVRLGRDDSLIAWIEALDCPWPVAHATCHPEAAMQRLHRSEPDNAAVWLLAHSRADEDSIEAGRLLDAAANSTRYRLAFGDIGALMHEQYAAVESPQMQPEVAQALAEDYGQAAGTVPDVAGIQAMATAAAVALPEFSSLRRACVPPDGARITPDRHEACTAIYTLMSEDPLLITQRVALVSLVGLSAGSPEGQGWRERLRQLHWIVTNAQVVLARATPPGYTRAVWRDGELPALKALLAGAGIPAVPAADWLPEDSRTRELIRTGRETQEN
ncbi:MAG: hypothetical protein M3Q42_02535 [Pseudomonadota bacterium]|nr:hypothetical protein [Pseudomonadota bacterium]